MYVKSIVEMIEMIEMTEMIEQEMIDETENYPQIDVRVERIVMTRVELFGVK